MNYRSGRETRGAICHPFAPSPANPSFFYQAPKVKSICSIGSVIDRSWKPSPITRSAPSTSLARLTSNKRNNRTRDRSGITCNDIVSARRSFFFLPLLRVLVNTKVWQLRLRCPTGEKLLATKEHGRLPGKSLSDPPTHPPPSLRTDK